MTGKELRKLRKELKLSQLDFALKIGLKETDQPVISQAEKADVVPVRIVDACEKLGLIEPESGPQWLIDRSSGLHVLHLVSPRFSAEIVSSGGTFEDPGTGVKIGEIIWKDEAPEDRFGVANFAAQAAAIAAKLDEK